MNWILPTTDGQQADPEGISPGAGALRHLEDAASISAFIETEEKDAKNSEDFPRPLSGAQLWTKTSPDKHPVLHSRAELYIPQKPAVKEDRGDWWSGETAYPHCSQDSMVPLDRGAPLLLLPTAAQLCPLQLLLQLGDLAEEMEGKDSEARPKYSDSFPG